MLFVCISLVNPCERVMGHENVETWAWEGGGGHHLERFYKNMSNKFLLFFRSPAPPRLLSFFKVA